MDISGISVIFSVWGVLLIYFFVGLRPELPAYCPAGALRSLRKSLRHLGETIR